MRRKVTIFVSGRVQGVYFRIFTQNHAKQLGVYGTARNLSDGRVEVVAEAESEAIDKLIQWCRKGPPKARVENVEIIEQEADGRLISFEIY